MKTTRTANSMRNMFVGFILQAVTTVFSFVLRTIFIKLLGEQFLGINGLYSNILQFFSLTDLGITTAFIYSLYKPLAQKDYNNLSAYLRFFRKVYYIIAIVILILGFLCVPLLPYIVRDSALPGSELTNYFILSFVNTAVSYLGVFKSSLIKADQKEYIIKIITTSTFILRDLVQIFVLYFTKNYYLYLSLNIATTALNNLLLTVTTNKLYPKIRTKKEELDREQKKAVLNDVGSVMVYKVGAVTVDSSANILISILLGTVVVGYYSNYALIISIITTFIGIVSSAVLGSIGNLGAEGKRESIKSVFHSFFLFYHVVAAFCAACFFTVMNDFISIWLNDPQFIVPIFDVAFIIFAFYINCISNPIWMFRESLGYFKKAKRIMIICALLNILLSVILGMILGLGGILLANALARILTLMWYEPKYLYRDAFDEKYSEYWKRLAVYTIQSILIITLSSAISCLIKVVSLPMILVKVAVCGVTTLVVFALFNFRNKDAKYIVDKLRGLLYAKTKK